MRCHITLGWTRTEGHLLTDFIYVIALFFGTGNFNSAAVVFARRTKVAMLLLLLAFDIHR